MAFNVRTFRTRALTAVVFVAVMLAGLGVNQWSFLVLFSLIHFGCWWEYLRLTEKIHTTNIHPYAKFGWMLLGYGILLFCGGPVFQVAGYGLRENFSLPVSAAGFVLLLLGIFQKGAVHPGAFARSALGLLYLSFPWGAMLLLYQEGTGALTLPGAHSWYPVFLPAFVIACMWINDTMAYIVGSLIGKTPLSSISPKKTWEGTIGGIILAASLVGFAATKADKAGFFGQSLFTWILLATLAAVTGTIGDLLESKLKRMAGVKDSGHLMPGHGGFLDRFDSLLLATPVVWVFVQIVMK